MHTRKNILYDSYQFVKRMERKVDEFVSLIWIFNLLTSPHMVDHQVGKNKVPPQILISSQRLFLSHARESTTCYVCRSVCQISLVIAGCNCGRDTPKHRQMLPCQGSGGVVSVRDISHGVFIRIYFFASSRGFDFIG